MLVQNVKPEIVVLTKEYTYALKWYHFKDLLQADEQIFIFGPNTQHRQFKGK